MKRHFELHRNDRVRALLGTLGIGVGIALAFPASDAIAQAFPSKPVRMIVPNGAGSPTDIVARLLGVKYTEYWGQPVLTDNRPGATGLIGAEALAKAPPDGHTMILMAMTQLIGTLMYQRYQLATEFAPVSMVGTTPFAIAIPASLPVKTIPEWIAYVKARPGQLMYSSSGQWGSSHLCLEAFNEVTGLQMTHVPHPTSPAAMNAVVAEQVVAFCPAGPTVQTYLPGGKIRVLGSTYKKPNRLLPGIPPIADSVPGFELLGWYGLEMHLKTPSELVNRVNADTVRALRQPDIQEKLFFMGVEAVGSTPAEFSSFLRSESERWSKLLKDRNAKPE